MLALSESHEVPVFSGSDPAPAAPKPERAKTRCRIIEESDLDAVIGLLRAGFPTARRLTGATGSPITAPSPCRTACRATAT